MKRAIILVMVIGAALTAVAMPAGAQVMLSPGQPGDDAGPGGTNQGGPADQLVENNPEHTYGTADNSYFGYLGLIGLFGVAGLMRRRRASTTASRSADRAA